MISKPIQLPPPVERDGEQLPAAFQIVEEHASTSSRQSVNGQHVVTAGIAVGGTVVPAQWRLGMN